MSRFAALCAAVLLSPPAAQAELTLSGFLQQNTAKNTVAANPDGRHYKWLEERAQLKLDATGGAGRLLAKRDFSYDHLRPPGQTQTRRGAWTSR